MTRRFLLLTAALIAFSASAQAQPLRHWGILAGYTNADQEWTPSVFDTESRDGFHAGLYAEWLSVPYVSITSELLFTQKGYGHVIQITGEEGPTVLRTLTIYTRFDYLSLPVLGKLSLPSRTLSPYLLAGPRIDVLVGHAQEYDFMKSVNDRYKTFVFGMTVGAGIQAPAILPGNIFVEFRANFDITDSFKGDYNDLIRSEVKNRSFDISFGAGF